MIYMTASEVLQQARDLISDPKRWTQGTYAKTKEGSIAYPPTHKDAYCFCSIGAIARVQNLLPVDAESSKAVGFLTQLVTGQPGVDDRWAIPEFNDSRTHDEVLQMFDFAIEAARKEEAESQALATLLDIGTKEAEQGKTCSVEEWKARMSSKYGKGE